jgi:TRAP-type C4-dicarboxylate transport system permease small subunit|tara:strand:+ start:60 stop:551 length:492 start_codon:yes stop_codon:yes gene_type:complete
MLCKIDKFLNSLYRYSGYVASFFLILILATIILGISSRIFGFYIRGLTEYSGYSLATASFLALAYTFNENGHIRITLFLEKAKGKLLKFLTIWCLAVSTFFSGFLAFYFIKMWVVSIQLEERSQGADEILLWIPQTGVAVGSIIFFICITHHFLKLFFKKQNA